MKTDQEKRRERVLAAYAQTGGIKATARMLRVSIHVVRRVLRGKDKARGAPRTDPVRPSKLDDYKPVIRRLVLDEHLTAALVMEEIRALGYTGGHTILQTYVRTIRPAPKAKLTTVVEHPPGAEGQVDWSPYTVKLGGETRVVHAFSLVLPFSRYMVVRFALDEKLETLILLHEEAFTEIGGAPPRMTYDNMTTVGRHVGPGEVWLNPRFVTYAERYGFAIGLIKPGHPNEHASVERPFHYIEHNCLPRRRAGFEDLDDLNRHAKWWCANVANVRVHGTTRERPVDRLVRERPFLLPLPSRRPEAYRTLSRKVGTDFCVRVGCNRYSVPPKVFDHPATVREYADRIEILVDGALVATHEVCKGRDQRIVLPEHEEAFKRCTPSRRLLEAAFVRLGPAAEDYYAGLKAQRGPGAGYHLQRILKLADRHGSPVVTGAMAHAARYGNYSADAVARVIAGREIQDRTTELLPEVAPPPERVRRWLEGLDVEDGDLADYDRIIDRLGGEEEGDAEGQGHPADHAGRTAQEPGATEAPRDARVPGSGAGAGGNPGAGIRDLPRGAGLDRGPGPRGGRGGA